VLLVPKRFLKDIPVVTPDNFWRYAWNNHAETLRLHFNYDIARHVDNHEKARLARQNRSIVAEYLTALEREDHKPYDVDKDPKLRVRWWEMGGDIVAKSTRTFVPDDPSQFPQFVATIIDIFKHGIEHQDEWRLLWHLGVAMPEKKVQAVFRSCIKHYCRANDVAVVGEANAGRGPVDFEFALGWIARSQVEMKLMSSSKFWNGVLTQTPEYAIAADVYVAYFVAIAYTDTEMNDSMTNKVKRAAHLASQHHAVEVRPIIIDARPKDSASHMKPSKDLREQLHRSQAAVASPSNEENREATEGSEDDGGTAA
jgi:hypothetical protein